MRCDRKDFDRDLNDLWGFVSTHMPPGWRLEFVAVEGEVSMGLYDPEGEYFDVYDCEGDVIDYWVDHVNDAREAAGLTAVQWEDQC